MLEYGPTFDDGEERMLGQRVRVTDEGGDSVVPGKGGFDNETAIAATAS